MKKRLLSILMTLVMLFNLVPYVEVAASDVNEEADKTYISLSFDGQYLSDKDGAPVAYRAVSLDELADIDLTDYSLDNYNYDADGDGVNEITALHLYIYTHEEICGLDWSDVSVSGGAGSIFFESGLFGYSDCNLRYDLNGAYPQVDGWGLTADQIVLYDGDFMDIASYSSWSFYSDSATGFHYFADENNEITHSYEVEENKEVSVKLVRAFSDMFTGMAENVVEPGYEISYGETIGEATETVVADEEGCATITFPTAGTWYVWCDGGYGNENPGDIVSSPACAEVTVTENPLKNIDHTAIYDATRIYISTLGTPTVGSVGGEWMVIDLTRDGVACPEGYYENVETYVTDKINDKEQLHRAKSTDNSRVILALTAAGYDVTNVAGHNLLFGLTDMSFVKKQGLNGPIWALIAFDCHKYDIPANDAATEQVTREKLISYILEKQLEDGGWALSGTVADTDMTGMAIQSLAPYYNTNNDVKNAVDAALVTLSNKQHDNGGFGSIDGICSESSAQVIVALTALGINPETDARFVKNGVSVVDSMCSFAIEGGGFAHTPNAGINGMATEQGQCALVAYYRFLNNKTSLYDMTDVTITQAPTQAPIATPTAEPTVVPTQTPAPTAEPTVVPTQTPAPTAEPTVAPTPAPAAPAAPTVEPTIKPVQIEKSIKIVGKTKIKVGKTYKYRAKLKGIKGKVKWSVNKKKFAVVSKNGKLKAKKKGTVKLTAKIKKYKYTLKIKITK